MTPTEIRSARPWSKVLFQASIVAMVAINIGSLLEIASGRIWIGQLLWISPVSFSTVFIGTAILVRRRGLGYMDSFLVALTTMVSMIWMYEIFYHFGFFVDWEFAQQPPQVLANYNEPVITDILLTSVGLVGLRYMHGGILFAVSLSAFLIIFVIWVIMGYPQVSFPGTLYPFGTILIHVPNPDAWAYPLNALTKLFLGFTYISLFVGKPISGK